MCATDGAGHRSEDDLRDRCNVTYSLQNIPQYFEYDGTFHCAIYNLFLHFNIEELRSVFYSFEGTHAHAITVRALCILRCVENKSNIVCFVS